MALPMCILDAGKLRTRFPASPWRCGRVERAKGRRAGRRPASSADRQNRKCRNLPSQAGLPTVSAIRAPRCPNLRGLPSVVSRVV